MDNLNFDIKANWELVKRLREEVEKLESALMKVNAQANQDIASNLAGQIASLKNQIREITTEASKIGVSVAKGMSAPMVGGYDNLVKLNAQISLNDATIGKLKDKIDATTLKYDKLGQSGSSAMSKQLASLNTRLAKEVKNNETLRQSYDKLGNELKELAGRYETLKGKSTEAGNAFEGIAGRLKGAILGIGSVYVLKELGQQVINTRQEFQLLESTLQTLVGSKEKADKLMLEIKDYAIKSPLTLSDVQNSVQMMLGFGISLEKVMGNVKMLGDISMGNSAKFNALALAFSQMSATGRLMGQDLLQMINAGFNPLTVIAQKTGKTIAELKKEMEKGAISTEMVTQAFKDATSAGGKYYKMTENAQNTITASKAQMEGALQEALNRMGESQQNIISGSYKMLTKIIQNYDKLTPILLGVVASIGLYKTALLFVDVAQNKLVFSTKQLATAFSFLNKVVLKNPYVIAGTALITLISLMVAFKGKADLATQSQEKLNKALDEFAQKQAEEKAKQMSLIGIIQSETASAIQKKLAYEDLKKLSKELTDQYSLEQIERDKLSNTEKKLNDIQGKEALSNLEKEKGKKEKEIADLEKKRDYLQKGIVVAKKEAKTALDRAREAEFGSGEKRSDVESYLLDKNKIAQYNKQIDALKNNIKGLEDKIRSAKGLDITPTFDKAFQENTLKELESTFQKAKEKVDTFKGDLGSPAYIKLVMDMGTAYQQVVEFRNFLSQEGNTWRAVPTGEGTNQTTVGEQKKKLLGDLAKEQATYNDLLKDSSKATKKEIEDQKKKVEGLESELKVLGWIKKEKGGGSKDNSKAEEERRDLQLAQLAKANEREKIEVFKQGMEKRRALAKLEYETTLEDLRKQQEEMQKIKPLSSSEGAVFSTAINIANEKFKQNLNDIANEEKKLLSDVVAEFETSEQKKFRISQEYSKKLLMLMALNKNGELSGNIAQLIAIWNDAISKMNLDELKKNMNWEALFGDLQTQSTSSLENTISLLKEVISKASLEPADMKVLVDQLNNAQSQLASKNPFSGYKASMDKVKKAQKEVNTLQQEYNSLINSGTATTDQITNAFNKLRSAENNLSQAQKEVNDKVNAFGATGKDMLSSVSDVMGVAESLGVKIPDQIKGALEGVGQVMDSLAEVNITNPFSMIKAATGVLAGLAKTVTSIFAGKKNVIPESVFQQYDSLKRVIALVTQQQNELLKSMTAMDAIDVSKKTKELYEKQIQASRNLGRDFGNSYLEGFKHTVGYHLKLAVNKYSKSLQASGFDVSKWDKRASQIWDLSADELRRMREQNIEFWASLDPKVQDYLNNIIETDDQIKQLGETTNEVLTGISFDSVKNALSDLISSTDTTFEDISNSFEENMRQAIVKVIIDGTLKSRIEKWYKDFAKAMEKGKMTEQETTDLRKEWEDIINTGKEMQEEALKAMGIDSDSTKKKNANGNGFQTMSQDTGNELNGRFTALQIAGEELRKMGAERNNILLKMLGYMDALISTYTGGGSPDTGANSGFWLTVSSQLGKIGDIMGQAVAIADENRNILINSYIELKAIARNTEAVIKPIKTINDTLLELKPNIKRL